MKLFFYVFMIVLCISGSACAPKTTVYLQGKVESADNINVDYVKSEEQQEYEKQQERTKGLLQIPAKVFLKVFEIPIGLAAMPIDGIVKEYRKFEKDLQRREREKKD